MNPKSASSLVWLSVVLLLLGVVAMNPTLRFGLSVTAGIIAAIPAILGRKRLRIAGIVIFVVSAVIATVSYPASKQHMEQYKKRIEEQARLTSRASRPNPAGSAAELRR